VTRAAGESKIRRLARSVDAATPPQRDRAVDALRALAIAGVIGGHWLVTALVPGSGASGAGVSGLVLRDDSPLTAMPALAPVSWLFQTLAVFFLVGGYSAARGYRGGDGRDGYYRAWLRRRLARLARPVAVLAAVWIPLTAGLWLAGVPGDVTRTLLTLVIDPLWFLGVYAVLTALTPAGLWLVRRLGLAAAAVPFAIVALDDLVRFGLHGPGWVGWINLPAGWLVPYLFGIAWATGHIKMAGSPRSRRVPVLMLAGGATATAALIAWAGYPASMVGVNGAAISNLNPPTLAAVTFGIAQCGLALLLHGPLNRWMRRPVAWAIVATANLSAMTLFLWHQTAFIVVCTVGLAAGDLFAGGPPKGGSVPGLLTDPSNATWIAERLAWIPVFAVVLAVLWLLLHRTEHPRIRKAGTQAPAANRQRAGTPAGQCPGRRQR
jgi:hypothetical protein